MSEYLESLGFTMVQEQIEKRCTQLLLSKTLKRVLNTSGTGFVGMSPTKGSDELFAVLLKI